MTEAEQLEELRARPDWPRKKLDALAAQAAAIGRLREAVEETDRVMGERVARSSNSTVTTPAFIFVSMSHPRGSQVPVSDFSDRDNRSNLWYHRLWLDLHRVLGLNVPLGEWEGED